MTLPTIRIIDRPSITSILAFCLAGLLSAPAAIEGQEAPVDSLAEHARELHRQALVIDGHNDLPWRIRNETELDIEAMNLEERLEEGHTDLVRLREGGVGGQFWAAYVPVEFIGRGATAVVLEQIDLIERLARRYPERLEMAYTADDVERIAGEGKTASLIGIEGGHAISNSLPVLRQLYRAGARYLTLTHSGTLAWADAAGDTAVHGGLTEFGREVVREMNRLGMLVDLSHVTADVMRDALEVAEAPVIFSHSSANALAEHPRNVPDDVLLEVRENGGVVMVNFYSAYLLPEGARIMRDLFGVQREFRERHPDPEEYERAMERWREENPIPRGQVGIIADHIDHVVQVAGIDHVGLGSDYDGVTVLPEEMGDVSRFPVLTEELLRRGYSDGEVRKILGENVLRALREAERVAAELQVEREPAIDRLPYHGIEPEREEGGT